MREKSVVMFIHRVLGNEGAVCTESSSFEGSSVLNSGVSPEEFDMVESEAESLNQFSSRVVRERTILSFSVVRCPEPIVSGE